jgi:hypothetical protein
VKEYEGDDVHILLSEQLNSKKLFNVTFDGKIVKYSMDGRVMSVSRSTFKKDNYQVEFCNKRGLVIARGYLSDLEVVEDVDTANNTTNNTTTNIYQYYNTTNNVTENQPEERPVEEIQPIVAESEEVEVDEDAVVEEVDETGTVIHVMYRKSFAAKIMTADADLKNNFVEIANYMLNYKKVHQRDSFSCSTFNYGRTNLAKLSVRGKTLTMYLALDPKEYVDSKYFGVDVSDVKKYEDVPLKIKIKSDRGLKFAKELFDKVVEKFQLEAVKEPKDTVLLEDYPRKTKEKLLEENLIKRVIVERKEGEAVINIPEK